MRREVSSDSLSLIAIAVALWVIVIWGIDISA
jgi:hypothetical protein